MVSRSMASTATAITEDCRVSATRKKQAFEKKVDRQALLMRGA
jgi:hypothetical protein